MKKIIQLSLLVIILLAFALSASSAEAAGCFLYKDSTAYCLEISPEEAEAECSILDRCSVQEVFNEGTSCATEIQCQTIICSSTCLEDFTGRCPAGPVTDSDTCRAGCCQFTYSLGTEEATFCDYMLSKRRCEIEVSNKQEEEYYFNPQLPQESCQQWCSQGKAISTTLETISPGNTFPEPREPSSDNGSSTLWSTVIIIILVIGSLVILFFLLRRYLAELIAQSEQQEKPTPPPTFWKIFSPFNTSDSKQPNVAQKKRQLQVKQQRREQFLSEKGLLADKKPDNFRTLGRIAKGAKKKPEQKEQKDVFSKLQELAKK
ncbi:MAG TPA: hypothetical protein VJI15_04335 [Candidatus Nanoarchaeia archaeon]|nr:hypothetical protein [Candidatus Nanoarchaeia archaeon]